MGPGRPDEAGQPAKTEPWRIRADTVRLAIRLTPKARRSGLLGLQQDADGAVMVKAAVTAAPENGKANAALVALLAATLGIAKRDITLVQGDTDRRKVVEIAGDVSDVVNRIRTVVNPLRGP